MATFDLLHASIVAVSSAWFSFDSGKPPEKRITILRPGMLRRFFARLRTASSIVRAPKSACALNRDDMPIVGVPVEANVTAASGGALGSTADPFTPETAARRRTELAVKFWTMRREPLKSTMAIRLSGP